MAILEYQTIVESIFIYCYGNDYSLLKIWLASCSCAFISYQIVPGMALFIFYTTCAMMMRWVPGINEV